MAKREKHYHLLKRHFYKNGEAVFFCTNNCNYKVQVRMALGKEVICNVCGKLFRMNEYSIRLSRPRCNDCVNRKGAPQLTQTTTTLDNLGVELPQSLLDKEKEIKTPVFTNPVKSLRDRLTNVYKPRGRRVEINSDSKVTTKIDEETEKDLL